MSKCTTSPKSSSPNETQSEISALAAKVALVDEILTRPDLTDGDKVVLIAMLLKFHNSHTGQCNPKRETLADYTRRTSRAVTNAISRGITAGLVAAKKDSRESDGLQTSNLYAFPGVPAWNKRSTRGGTSVPAKNTGIEHLPLAKANGHASVPRDEEKERGRENGEAISTAKWLYTTGKRILAEAEKPPKDPGALISKWLRDFGERALADALVAAEPKHSPEPVAYIEGVLRKRAEREVDRDCFGRPYELD